MLSWSQENELSVANCHLKVKGLCCFLEDLTLGLGNFVDLE